MSKRVSDAARNPDQPPLPQGDARPAPQDLRASERLRAQRTPAPEDQALYRCQCGYSFKAEVSTSVGCPHCGTEQAW